MITKKYRTSILLSIVVLMNFFYYNKNMKFIEEIDIPAGIGYDIEEKLGNINYYRIPINTYIFSSNQPVTTQTHTGVGETLLETRQDRQLQSNRKFLLGSEKIYLLNENLCYDGIEDVINVLFFNPSMNSKAFALVCSEKPEDILNFKVKGYISSSDYIYGMIGNSVEYNFYPENQFNVSNIYTKIHSEAANSILPYIQIKDNSIKITGSAVFNKDKLMYVLNNNETKILNLLRKQKTKGVFSLEKNKDDYAEVECYATRKVKCRKENNKYTFDITVKIDGDIIDYKSPKYKLLSKEAYAEIKSRLENKLNRQFRHMTDKMQDEYQLDLLGLSEDAIAKFGRRTGKDWNKIVSDSKINFNIKIKLRKQARGRI